jgi:hypothetical protein
MVLLVIKIFFLNTIVEPFRGLYELEIVFEGVLASVFASYVFYFIVVHYKEINDKYIIYPIVISLAKSVIDDCTLQLVAFAKETNIEMHFESLSLQDIDNVFKKINPHNRLLSSHEENWFKYLKYNADKSKQQITLIMSQMIFLDALFVSRIMVIYNSHHFKSMDNIAAVSTTYKDLTAFSKDFFDYCCACKMLNDYLNKSVYWNFYAMKPTNEVGQYIKTDPLRSK